MEKNSNKILERAKNIKLTADLRARQKKLKERLKKNKRERDTRKFLGIRNRNSGETYRYLQGKLYKSGKESVNENLVRNHEHNLGCLENKHYTLIDINVYDVNNKKDKENVLILFNKIKEILYDESINLGNTLNSLIENILDISRILDDENIKKEIQDIVLDFSRRKNISFINYSSYFDCSKKEERLLLQNVYLNQSEVGYKGLLFDQKVFDLSEDDEKNNFREIIYNLSFFNKVSDIPMELFDLSDINQKAKYLEIQVNLLGWTPEIAEKRWHELIGNNTLNGEVSTFLNKRYDSFEDEDVLYQVPKSVKRYMDFLTGKNKLSRDRKKDVHKESDDAIETDYMFESIKRFYNKARAIVPDFRKDSLVGENKESTLNKQKSILLDILKILDETGCLKDLIETQEIEINELLSDENKIRKPINVDSFITQVKNMDNVIEVAIYLRHFANKLSHNIEDFGFFVFYNDFVNNRKTVEDSKESKLKSVDLLLKDVSRKDLIPFSDVLIYSFGMRDVEYRKNEYKNILKTIDRNLEDEKVPIGIIRNQIELLFNQHYKSDENALVATVSSYFKEMEEIERKYKTYNVDNGIRCDYFSFSEFLREYIETKSYDKENNHNYFRKIFEEKFADNPEILNRLDILLDKIRVDSRFVDREKLIDALAKYMDVKNAAFQIKQMLNVQLAEVAKKSDDIIFQNSIDSKGNGIADIVIPGYIQVFGSHYKLYESEFVNSQLSTFPVIDPEISEPFEKSLDSVSVCIPLGKLTQAQINEFRNMHDIIYALEFSKEIDKEKYNCNRNGMNINLYQRLKDLKDNNPDKYTVYKLQILLGSGIEYYKRFVDWTRLKDVFGNIRRNDSRALENALGEEALEEALDDTEIKGVLEDFNKSDKGDESK